MPGKRFTRWIVVIGALPLVTTSSILTTAEPVNEHLRADWPECPHDWSIIEVAKTDKQTDLPGAEGFNLPTGTSVAREKTNIPEFHDCQRIILEDGTSYGPLMAVFAAADLHERRFGEPDQAALKRTMAAAEIFNDSADFSYPPLGIRPKFNCLYIARTADGRLRAKMVHVGDTEQDCGKPVDFLAVVGKELLVRETLAGRYSESDFPPVARWDWDPVHRQQYIGIKCGHAWCEIGRPQEGTRPAFVSSASHIPPPAGGTLAGSDRVRVIKGWYDQQFVAIANGLTLKPGKVIATFFPHPDVGTYQDSLDFAAKWIPVSYVAFSGPPGDYKAKFNFDQVAPGAALTRMNELSFCYGTRAKCNVPTPLSASLTDSCGNAALFVSMFSPRWWVRIGSHSNPPGHRYMYKCVVRRLHLGVPIPATTRWRWLADDETEWESCPDGCCEVQARKKSLAGT